jgi:hypothetical protein
VLSRSSFKPGILEVPCRGKDGTGTMGIEVRMPWLIVPGGALAPPRGVRSNTRSVAAHRGSQVQNGQGALRGVASAKRPKGLPPFCMTLSHSPTHAPTKPTPRSPTACDTLICVCAHRRRVTPSFVCAHTAHFRQSNCLLLLLLHKHAGSRV